MKALYRGAKVLILDEPTGVLTPIETFTLFAILRRLKDEGRTILLITHKLNEIIEITDRVSVMRAGEIVGEHKTDDVSAATLAEEMIGRPIVRHVEKNEAMDAQTVLEVSHITVTEEQGHRLVDDVSFTIKQCEVLGIAGVSGNGQSELIEVITGMRTPNAGTVSFKGKTVTTAQGTTSPSKLRDMGMGHVAEDRHHHAMVGDMSARDNALLGYQSKNSFNRMGWLKKSAIDAYAHGVVDHYDVRPANTQLPLSGFSGGNQQKLVIGRELSHAPDLIVVGQPTRGVDIGSICFIHDQLIAMRNRGGAVLLVSAELDELLSLSDRIIVMCEGRVTGEVIPGRTSEREIGLLMAGQKQGDAA